MRPVVLAQTARVKVVRVLAHLAKILPWTWMPCMSAGEQPTVQRTQSMCKGAMRVLLAIGSRAMLAESLLKDQGEGLKEGTPSRPDQTRLFGREDGEGGWRQSKHQSWLCLPRAEPC